MANYAGTVQINFACKPNLTAPPVAFPFILAMNELTKLKFQDTADESTWQSPNNKFSVHIRWTQRLGGYWSKGRRINKQSNSSFCNCFSCREGMRKSLR